jgi:hypothetical protein
MYDGIHWAGGENGRQGIPVENVDFVKLDVTSANLLDPFERLFAAIVEVIDHYDVVVGIQQLDYGMATDIAGPTGYQYSHGFLSCVGFKYHHCLGRCPAMPTLD